MVFLPGASAFGLDPVRTCWRRFAQLFPDEIAATVYLDPFHEE